jgi:hypothetical protein
MVFCCAALMVLVAFSSHIPFYAFAHREKRAKDGAGTQGWLALGRAGLACLALLVTSKKQEMRSFSTLAFYRDLKYDEERKKSAQWQS